LVRAWPAIGPRQVTVTVASPVGTATGTGTLEVVPWRYWLPIIQEHTE
jgi:hypothetical protein